jgi:hypothetical protein
MAAKMNRRPKAAAKKDERPKDDWAAMRRVIAAQGRQIAEIESALEALVAALAKGRTGDRGKL